jgi:uncharacterized protein
MIEYHVLYHPISISHEKTNQLILQTQKELRGKINSQISLMEYNIPTKDGEKLNGLYFHNPQTQNYILIAHGNAGNLYHWMDLTSKLGHITSIFFFDYRGYGKSTGHPSDKGLKNDIFSVWNFLVYNLYLNPSNITLYGISLGCSLVLWLGKKLIKLKRRVPHYIIIQSGFYNLWEIAADLFSHYLTYFLQSNFDNCKYIHQIDNKIKILIIHSQDDEYINVKHAYKLQKIKNNQIKITTGNHNNINFKDIYENIAQCLYQN